MQKWAIKINFRHLSLREWQSWYTTWACVVRSKLWFSPVTIWHLRLNFRLSWCLFVTLCVSRPHFVRICCSIFLYQVFYTAIQNIPPSSSFRSGGSSRVQRSQTLSYHRHPPFRFHSSRQCFDWEKNKLEVKVLEPLPSTLRSLQTNCFRCFLLVINHPPSRNDVQISLTKSACWLYWIWGFSQPDTLTCGD